MADLLSLRQNVAASQAAVDAQQAVVDNIAAQLDNIDEIPPAQRAAYRERIEAELRLPERTLAVDQNNLNTYTAAYQAALLADPLHPADPGLPLVLLPVRIETAYFPTDTGMDLVVRVYPDDIHVDTHEPELTVGELAAGIAYWQAVWGAGPNQARLDAAWFAILSQLKPARAAWSVRALHPSEARPVDETPIDQPQPIPPLPDVPTRPGTFNRPARTTLLPDQWRIVGLRSDGTELFYAEGSAIPDTLDLSFGPPVAGAPDSNLPFQDSSLWLVDLDAAIAAGMAVRIPLTGPDFTVAQLFVLGTSAGVAPDDAASRLESALVAHQYTNGLGFLPPGTPTNNTAQTRSAWQSAPPIPSPADLDSARAGYQAGSNQNAAIASLALGVDGTEVLSVAPDGLTDQQSDITTLQTFLWPAVPGQALLWLYTTWDIPAGGVPTQGSWRQHIDFPFVQTLQSHASGWVRSRGTLPVMRIGNQPYGMLPALSLNDWVVPPGDPLAPLVTWLLTLRSYWAASMGPSPYVLPGEDPDADSTIVNILKRLPVSVDIQMRAEADPVYQDVSTLPVGPIPSLPFNSELFVATPSTTAVPLPVGVVNDSQADHDLLMQYQAIFTDAMSVLEQSKTMTSACFQQKYQKDISMNGFPDAPPPDLFISLIIDACADPLAQNPAVSAGSTVAGEILAFAFYFDLFNAQPGALQKLLPVANDFIERFNIMFGANPAVYEAAIRESFDVFSHRLDAWITSLAARRLDDMRAAKPSGLVLGAYGWVENLAPRGDVSDQVYIHAPSMNHAATAAVLRSGYDSHGASGPLGVNLTSSRVRDADWLAAGVRSGQTTGALLGYRFERGLHENNLDNLIAGLRASHPLPLPSGPDADVNGQAALEAIAARNVVDGLFLSKNQASVLAELNLGVADAAVVSGLLTDLANVIDAFGDLLLAESVHHLVGGNPLRAGLTADTAGRGEPVPDSFEVTQTPRSGRSLTWQLGALLPAGFRSAATGWQISRPRAAVEPHVEAWAESIIGNAASWTLVSVLTTPDGSSEEVLTLDALGLCALDVVAESSGSPSQLESRIVEAISAGMPVGSSVSVSKAPNSTGAPGFGELISLTDRIRRTLGKATPLSPQHLRGAGSSGVAGMDVGDLDTRATALGASLHNAVQALQGAAQALGASAGADNATMLAAVVALRLALIGLADTGVPAAWPAGGSDPGAANVATLSAQAASLLAATQALAAQTRPPLPAAGASQADVAVWLAATTEYVAGIIGTGVPFIPAYTLGSDSAYAAAFAEGAAPAGGDPTAVLPWLRRIARIRENSAALHDILLAAEALQSATPGLTVAQLPAAPGAPWAALPFPGAPPPTARLALVFSTPAPIDPAVPFCGFICDTWTEHLPGVTAVARGDRGYEASEVTGMAFKADTPSAAAPQSLLFAISPDPSKPWSFDILFDTVRETLDLAKIRPVDLGDLVRFFRVLPAIHSTSYVEDTLNNAIKMQAAGGNK